MTLYPIKPRSLKVDSTVEATFATANGAFSGKDIQMVGDGALNIGYSMIENNTVSNRLAQIYPKIKGLKSGSKVQVPCFLRSTGTAASGTTAAKKGSDYGELLVLKTVMGGESAATGGSTVKGSSSTTTSIDVVASNKFAVGQAVCINGECSTIATIPDSDTITLNRALSAVPTENDVVYGSTTYYPTQAVDYSLQMQWRQAIDEYWSLLGVNGNFTLADLNPGQVPKINYDLQIASWTLATSAAIAAATYTPSQVPSIPGNASYLFMGTFGETTRTLYNASAVTINPGIDMAQVPTVSGIQGVSGYFRSKIEPTLEITLPYDDTFRTNFEADTAMFLQYQIGSTAGNIVFLEVPKFYIPEYPERVPHGNAAMMATKFKGEGREGSTTTNELTRAAIRIHLL